VSEFYMPTFRNTLFHLHRQVGMTYLPMKVKQTECSETSAYKIQTPGNYPEESIQQDIVVSIVTGLWTGELRNICLIPDGDK